MVPFLVWGLWASFAVSPPKGRMVAVWNATGHILNVTIDDTYKPPIADSGGSEPDGGRGDRGGGGSGYFPPGGPGPPYCRPPAKEPMEIPYVSPVLDTAIDLKVHTTSFKLCD